MKSQTLKVRVLAVGLGVLALKASLLVAPTA